MLISKGAFSVRHAISTDITRYNLNGIYLEPDGRVVATDGHRLAMFEPPSIDSAETFSDRLGEGTEEPIQKACIIPRETFERARKSIPKVSHAILPEHSRNVSLDGAHCNANGSVRFVALADGAPSAVEGSKIEGDFPDYRQVLPSGEPTAVFGCNAKYLMEACKAALEVANPKNHLVRIEVFDTLSPIRITAESPDTGRLTLVVMPMRI